MATPDRGTHSDNYDVAVLTRSLKPGLSNLEHVRGGGKTVGGCAKMLDGAEAVVNLAGRSVNCRYTPENRRKIIDSRIDSVRAIGEAILRCEEPPEVFVQAGSLAIYGDKQPRCDEDAPVGEGFSADGRVQWEGAFNVLRLPETRKVLWHIGFALGAGGGALEPLEQLSRRFLGGTIGSGEQYVS